MAMFDTRDFRNRVARTGSRGPIAGPLETFETAREAFADDTTDALQSNIIERTSRLAGAIHERLGKDVQPPFPQDTQVGGENFDQQVARFYEEVQALAEENPEAFEDLTTTEAGMMEDIRRDFKQSEEEFRETMSRASFLGQIGGVAGGITGGMQDPIALASMVAGAPAAASVARTAAIEAGIAGATEIPIQAAVQKGRADLGLDSGVRRAAQNIALAAAGGGLLGGGIRAAARGGGPLVDKTRQFAREKAALLQRNRQLKAATDLVQREADFQQRNPTIDVGPGNRQFQEVMTDDLIAASRGAEPSFQQPDAPIRQESLDRVGETAPSRTATEVSEEVQLAEDAAETVRQQVLSSQRVSEQQANLARNAIAEEITNAGPEQLARTIRAVEGARPAARRVRTLRRQANQAEKRGDKGSARGKRSAATKAEREAQAALREEGLEPSQRDIDLIAREQDEFAEVARVIDQEIGPTRDETGALVSGEVLNRRLREFADNQQRRKAEVEQRARTFNGPARAQGAAERMAARHEAIDGNEQEQIDAALTRFEDSEDEQVQEGLDELREDERQVSEIEDCARRTS